jgi:hypothetical protein
MADAHFKVKGLHLDGASEAKLTINRERGIAEVRPKGRRHVYRVRLSEVVEMIAWRAAKTGRGA